MKSVIRSLTRKLASSFELEKFKEKCNVKGCESQPEMVATISIFNPAHGKREIASIYICRSHVSEVKKFVEKYKKSFKGFIVDLEIKQMGR